MGFYFVIFVWMVSSSTVCLDKAVSFDMSYS